MLIAYDFFYKLSVTFVTFVLFVIVAVLGIGKIYVDRFSKYTHYFTNWAWTLYGIYYLLVFLGHTFKSEIA